ncbi:low molecular weight phosphatase family protein [Arthrobacter rhombi]|uniref:arsenate-mycothiol transferase ArsC n=1 Tax=Arthrobacter rhombi TaxID=71253 RepID=UPI0031D215AF
MQNDQAARTGATRGHQTLTAAATTNPMPGTGTRREEPLSVDGRPVVLFVCVKNGGKSQMAGALMRHLAGGRVDVRTAGTKPGNGLNAQSVQSLSELGIEIGDERPKPITRELLAGVDLVIILGREADLEPIPGARLRNWDIDEPTTRGIEGMERMRLVRDDIRARTTRLLEELNATAR